MSIIIVRARTAFVASCDHAASVAVTTSLSLALVLGAMSGCAPAHEQSLRFLTSDGQPLANAGLRMRSRPRHGYAPMEGPADTALRTDAWGRADVRVPAGEYVHFVRLDGSSTRITDVAAFDAPLIRRAEQTVTLRPAVASAHPDGPAPVPVRADSDVRIIAFEGFGTGIRFAPTYFPADESFVRAVADVVPAAAWRTFVWSDVDAAESAVRDATGQLVIVGFSNGGDAAWVLADRLNRRGVPVDLVCTLDPVPSGTRGVTAVVPNYTRTDSSARWVNFHQRLADPRGWPVAGADLERRFVASDLAAEPGWRAVEPVAVGGALGYDAIVRGTIASSAEHLSLPLHADVLTAWRREILRVVGSERGDGQRGDSRQSSRTERDHLPHVDPNAVFAAVERDPESAGGADVELILGGGRR